MVASAQLSFGQHAARLLQPCNKAKLDRLQKRMQEAGMVLSAPTHAGACTRTAHTIPLIVLLQDLLACQNQDPRTVYKQVDRLQHLFHAMQTCNGLALGHGFKGKQALPIAQLVGSLLLLLNEHYQLETVDIDKAVQQHLLLQAAVAKHMSQLLCLLLPFATDSTAYIALNTLAGGLEPFKAEGGSQQAVAALPSIGAFIRGLLPFLDDKLDQVDSNSSGPAALWLICDLLSVAIKTFKAAAEVSIRELGEEQDIRRTLLRDYKSMSHISALFNWQVLLSPVHLKEPQCTALLQSLLEIEAVWSLAIANDAKSSKTVPMLQACLSNSSRLADALYHCLLTHQRQSESNTSKSNLLGLLVLIKAVIKAADLLEAKTRAVMDLLLLPVEATSRAGSLCVLEILWLLTNGARAAVACRITEIFTLCMQHAAKWPKVSAFLLKNMDLPAKVINELHNLTASLPTAKEPTAWPWQPAAEQKAFMLSIVKTLLDNVNDSLNKDNRGELQRLYKASMPSKPLWDGDTIEHRSAVNPDAINTGDEAPASWDGPHLQADCARQAQCHAVQAQDPQSKQAVSTASSVQSQDQNANMTAGVKPATAAELLAKLEETQRKIAAAKAKKSRKKMASLEQQQIPTAEDPTVNIIHKPQVSSQAATSPSTKESCRQSNSDTCAAIQNKHSNAPGSIQGAQSPPSGSTILQQQHIADSPAPIAQPSSILPALQSPSFICKGLPNSTQAQAVHQCTAHNLAQLDQKTVDSARRRSTQAGLSSTALQLQSSAIVNNPPKVLRGSQLSQGLPYSPASTTAPQSQQTQIQNSPMLHDAPSQHAPMARTSVHAEVYNTPSLQTTVPSQPQDIGDPTPMDIDPVSPCQSFYSVVTKPFGQEPYPAFGHAGGWSVNGTDTVSATCSHGSPSNVHGAPASMQSMHGDILDFMDIDSNMC